MREETIFKAGGKEYKFILKIQSFVPMERELGKSLLSLINPAEGKFTDAMTIENMKTILKYGLTDIPKDDNAVYDFMDDFIADGGTIDTLAAKILDALLLKSDFFIPRAKEKKEQPKAKATTPKK